MRRFPLSLIRWVMPAVCVLAAAGANAAEEGFIELFDGKSLDGWVQRGGNANYTVRDGAIVGTSVPNTPNSFLCTEREYGDFVLEYEFKVHDELNSGVQIRSQVFDKDTEIETPDGKKRKIPAGRVHGYQVEIDANAPNRMWVGGIYDEGRRGWLFPGLNGGDAAEFTAQGKRLFKPGEWNSVRVVAQGDSIKTWLNGELRTDMTDSLTPRGFIALQVHGVGKREDPLFAMWRNIRIKELPKQ